MPASQTTRMPNGVTNAAPWQTLAAAGFEDPSWAYQDFNDFDHYTAGEWTITNTGTGAPAALAYQNGAITIPTSIGAADATYMQRPVASHKLALGDDYFFKFGGLLSEVTNCVFHCGLIATSATPVAAADGIFFVKATGQAGLVLNSVIGGVTTSVALPAWANLVAATYFELGFHVTQGGDIEVFCNPTTGSNPVNPANGHGFCAVIRNPAITQVLLNLSMGLLNSSGVIRNITCDYIGGFSHR